MEQSSTNVVSFCVAAGAEAARRWLLCPNASMAEYRDQALARLLKACDQPELAAERSREFCDGFASRIAKEIAGRSSDVHDKARRSLQAPPRHIRRRALRKPVASRRSVTMVIARSVL